MTQKILVLDRSEELADQVRDVAEELDESIEVVSCTRIGSSSHVQEHDGPFDVIVAGPSLGTRAGLKRLAILRQEMPGSAIVIAFEHRPDASLREIVQVGAIDLLEIPADDATVRQVLRRAFEFADVGPSVVDAHPAYDDTPHFEPVPAPPQRTARIFTVCSATGGCGKTFYATNMATYLARTSGKRVALVDLDLQFGEITTALRLQPPYTIVDAIRSEGEEDENPIDLANHIEDYLVRTEDNLWALAAPREPSQADFITPVDATRVLEALRLRFDYVVVDTPAALAETVLAALDLSEHMFVLATLDLPSVRNLGVFLQTLQKLRIPTDNVSLVLNKIEKDVGIDVGQIVKLFPQGFRSTLPYAREVSRSINVGKPVIVGYPEAEVSRALVAGLGDFLPEGERAREVLAMPSLASPPTEKGVLARLLRRKGALHGGNL